MVGVSLDTIDILICVIVKYLKYFACYGRQIAKTGTIVGFLFTVQDKVFCSAEFGHHCHHR
jgi:hypothetical protein